MNGSQSSRPALVRPSMTDEIEAGSDPGLRSIEPVTDRESP
jgi:hypothetical protein